MSTLTAPIPDAIPFFLGHRDNVTQRRQDYETVVQALTEATKNGQSPDYETFIKSLPEGLRPEASEVLWSLIDDHAISLGTHFEITVKRPLETPQIAWRNPADVTIPVEWDPSWRP